MIPERIPRYVIGRSRREDSDATSAYCPYCRWIGIYPTLTEAQAAGLEHAKGCPAR